MRLYRRYTGLPRKSSLRRHGDLKYPSERMASLVQLIKCWTAAVTVCAVTRKGGSEDCVGKLWARYVTERWGRGTVRRGKERG